jgi:hypothetical protein
VKFITDLGSINQRCSLDSKHRSLGREVFIDLVLLTLYLCDELDCVAARH